MSAQIIPFPRPSTPLKKTYRHKPYQRVFHLGYCDFGKPYWCSVLEEWCQEAEDVFLKRLRYDERVFKFYEKGIVREFLWCMTDELEETVQDLGLDDPPTRAELVEMGWRDPELGKVVKFANSYANSER